MNLISLKTPAKKTATAAILTAGNLALFLGACSGINDSWEVKGGGYLKYSINGEGSYSIELSKDDVEPPYYVNNSHHYFYMESRLEESDRKDQIALMVNTPSTGKDLTPVAKANINGKMETVSWMRIDNSEPGALIPDSSSIHFDEIINDSLWTAKVDLYFQDCRKEACNDELPPIHIKGRLRYWVPADER